MCIMNDHIRLKKPVAWLLSSYRQLLQTPSPEIPLDRDQGKGKGAENRTSAIVITGPELVHWESSLHHTYIKAGAVMGCRHAPPGLM